MKAVDSGHMAIMSPGEFCYFDSYQDAPDSQPEAIGAICLCPKFIHLILYPIL